MKVFWLHLRNSPIRFTIPVFIALDLAVLFLRSRYWIGVWPETGAAAQVPAAVFLGSVGAGAAAWAATAQSRHRLSEQLRVARTHPVVSEAYRLGATVVVLLLPYLVGSAVGFALTARTFPPGVDLWVGYTALGVVAVLLAAGWGWFLGRMLGSVFGGLAAIVSWFLLVSLSLRYDLGLTVVSGPPELMVDPAAVTLRLTAVLALLTALLWLPAPDQLRDHVPRLSIPASAGVVLGMVFYLTTPIVERIPADEVTCVDGDRTQLCVWPEQEKYLSLLEDVSARVDGLPEVFVVPPRMNEYGIERTETIDEQGVGYPVPGSLPYFYIIQGSPWSYAGIIADEILGATFDECTWPDELSQTDSTQLDAVDGWIEAYLAGGGSPDYKSNMPARMQEARADGRQIANELILTDQLRWAESTAKELRDRYCHPSG